MSNVARKLRFAAKVKIEREVLSIINSSELAVDYKLAGMTKNAVQTWRGKLDGLVDPTILATVVDKTLSISSNAHIISDTSRTVFADGIYFNNEKYDQDKTELKITLEINKTD